MCLSTTTDAMHVSDAVAEQNPKCAGIHSKSRTSGTILVVCCSGTADKKMATGVTNAKASQANNFRSKPGSVTSNIVTAPSRTVVKEPPPLFPPNPLLDELPKPKPDVYLLRKSVSIKQLFRSSPFFLQPQQKTKDIERYADKYFDKEPSLELNNVIVASSGMFPAELISDKDKKMLRANLLKRKVPDTIVQPSAVDVLEQTSKKGKKKKR